MKTSNSEFYNTKIIDYGDKRVVKKYLRNIRKGFTLSDDDKNSRRRKSDDIFRTQQQIEHSIQSSLNRTINKVYEYALSNTWEWFYTLTFNPDKVDSFNYDDVCKALKKWVDDTRKKYASDMMYIIIPELHKSGRYHFHGILSNCGGIPLDFSGHYTSSGNAIFNLPTYSLGFSTVSMISDSDKACSYCLKYITKELCAATFNKKRYWHSNNLKKPVTFEYCLSDNEFNEQLESVSDNITRVKTFDIVPAHNRINLYNLDN